MRPLTRKTLADYLEQYAIEKHQSKPAAEKEKDDLLADMPIGLPQDEVQEILRQVLEGLSYAHANKVLHLNLNPTNILRNSDGQIKLAELGLMTMAGKELFEDAGLGWHPPRFPWAPAVSASTRSIFSPPKPAWVNRATSARTFTPSASAPIGCLPARNPAITTPPPANSIRKSTKAGTSSWPTAWNATRTSVMPPPGPCWRISIIGGDIQGRGDPLDPGTAQTRSVFRHMDFIPVPRRIKRRGLKTTRAFRLGVIGLVGCVGLYLASMFYDLAFSKDVSPATPIAIRVPAGKEPRLSIRTTPPAALLEFSGQNLSFNIRDGTLDLNIVPGLHRFTVSAPHYKTRNELIKVGRDPQTLNIRLEPALADVNIITTPGAHAVAIDSSQRMYDLGTANADGLIQVAQLLYAGTYTLRLEKENYMPMEKENFRLGESGDNNLEFPLVPLPGTLRVRSTPKAQPFMSRARKSASPTPPSRDSPCARSLSSLWKAPATAPRSSPSPWSPIPVPCLISAISLHARVKSCRK